MAIIRRTVEQIAAEPGRIDRAKVQATSDADVERFQREDGFDPEEDAAFAPSLATAARRALGLTQPQMAALTQIPIATLRNWEQRRTTPDATARAFFKILIRQPEAAKKALAS